MKMSELSVEGQESKAVPDSHDQPPSYDLNQPGQDILTSVIETEHTEYSPDINATIEDT